MNTVGKVMPGPLAHDMPAALREAIAREVVGRRTDVFGAYQIVTHERVHDLSRDGWGVALVVPAQDFVAPSCEYCRKYNHCPRPLPESPAAVIDRPLFLLVRSRDEEFKKMKEERANWVNEARKRSDEKRELQEFRADVEKERDGLRDERDALQRSRDHSVAVNATLREKLQAIEGDLAKVRREVGEKEWKRICPPPPPPKKKEGEQ